MAMNPNTISSAVASGKKAPSFSRGYLGPAPPSFGGRGGPGIGGVRRMPLDPATAARPMDPTVGGSGGITAAPPEKPAWQKLQEMGVGGQGSTAGNRSKLAELIAARNGGGIPGATEMSPGAISDGWSASQLPGGPSSGPIQAGGPGNPGDIGSAISNLKAQLEIPKGDPSKSNAVGGAGGGYPSPGLQAVQMPGMIQKPAGPSFGGNGGGPASGPIVMDQQNPGAIPRPNFQGGGGPAGGPAGGITDPQVLYRNLLQRQQLA